MIIKVCIGSACHIYGSYNVVERLKELVNEHEADIEIDLKSSFCMGQCGKGVSVKVDDRDIVLLTPDNVDSFFNDLIKEIQ